MKSFMIFSRILLGIKISENRTNEKKIASNRTGLVLLSRSISWSKMRSVEKRIEYHNVSQFLRSLLLNQSQSSETVITIKHFIQAKASPCQLRKKKLPLRPLKVAIV